MVSWARVVRGTTPLEVEWQSPHLYLSEAAFCP